MRSECRGASKAPGRVAIRPIYLMPFTSWLSLDPLLGEGVDRVCAGSWVASGSRGLHLDGEGRKTIRLRGGGAGRPG